MSCPRCKTTERGTAGRRLYRRLTDAYWPPGGDPCADRSAGDAVIDRLRVVQVKTLLQWIGGPEQGGRGPTFCLLQERLAALGWRVE